MDLSGFGTQPRSFFPSLSASRDRARYESQPPDGQRRSLPVRTAPLTRESLLERYRAPKASASDIARAREHSGDGLSRARGASADPGASSSRTKSDRSAPPVSKETRKQEYKRATEKLGRLDRKDPETAKKLIRAGESIAVATDVALRATLGTSFGGCGSSPSTCWWDPCNNGWNNPNTSCWNHCGPCSWWWWNNCMYWLPSWGWGWSWGACWNNWCFGWSCHPYYCYPGYAYWGYSPWWYSSVIYDSYYPPEQQVVVVHEYEQQPAPEAGADAGQPARGEAAVGAANPPPEKRDPAMAQALARTAQQYVALGDLAFSERRYGDAVSHYAKAIEYAPDDAVLYMLLSDALFATGDYHYAASALRKSLELEPRLVDTIVDKHSVYRDPADFEKQLGYLESYLKDNALDEDARLVLAANYLFGNKPHQALDLLQSSFSLDVRKSRAGTLLFERSQKLAAENPFSK